jgi:hypothetical protein
MAKGGVAVVMRPSKDNFFDREHVQRSMDQTTYKAFFRFGAFVRKVARRSIRKRKKISDPGFPPSSHTDLLKDRIYFAWDSVQGSVVMGPEKINRPTEAPELLEFGGDVEVIEDGKPRRKHYRARPFMGPAFEAGLEKMPEMWTYNTSVEGA